MQKPYPMLVFVVAIAMAIGLMIWSMGETHGPSRDSTSYQSSAKKDAPAQPGVPLPPESNSTKGQ